jgi:hypothetical protein
VLAFDWSMDLTLNENLESLESRDTQDRLPVCTSSEKVLGMRRREEGYGMVKESEGGGGTTSFPL